MIANLLPCKSCGNVDQEQMRFQVFVDQGLEWNRGPYCHCLVCGSMFKAKSREYEDMIEAWNGRHVDTSGVTTTLPVAWRVAVKRNGKSYHEYTECEQMNSEEGYYSHVGKLEPLFDEESLQPLLQRLAKLEGAEIAAWNNWEALEQVQNFLIEHNLLLTPYDGEGEAAGKNIVHSIQAIIGKLVIQGMKTHAQPIPNNSPES
jgi:hypothetical protein